MPTKFFDNDLTIIGGLLLFASDQSHGMEVHNLADPAIATTISVLMCNVYIEDDGSVGVWLAKVCPNSYYCSFVSLNKLIDKYMPPLKNRNKYRLMKRDVC